MSVFAWFLWTLFLGSLGGPVQRSGWSEQETPTEKKEDGAPRPLFYHLPMFLHAQGPLVARELLRPVPHKSPLPTELIKLLLSPPRQDQSVQWPNARAVEVWCGIDQISVRLDRFQLRAWTVPTRFRLGSCEVSKISAHFLYFHHKLMECDGESKVVGGQLVYTFSLSYTPPPQGYIIRVPPLNLPIHCHYNRFHYSYQVGFRPQSQHTTFMKSIRSKLSFSLTVCNGQWEPLPPGHRFSLGDLVHFVAQNRALLPRERLYVDSCYATSSKDPNSMPKVDIITNYGCMTDSRRESSRSRFLFGGGHVLKFSVEAFLFRAVSQVLYLHCSMSISLTTSHTSKSCNYNNTAGRWEELEAPPSVCSCCDSTCTDIQDSTKNTVSSQGWFTGQNSEEKPRIRAISFQAEEGRESVDQENRKEERMNKHLKNVQTFPQITVLDHEEKKEDTSISVVPVEKKEWRQSVAVTQQRNTENDKDDTEEVVMEKADSQLKELAIEGNVMCNQTRPRDGSSTTTTITARNSSFGSDYDTTSCHDSVGNVNTTVIPVTTPCPNSDKMSCTATNGAVKHEKDSNSIGNGTISPVTRPEGLTRYKVGATSGISGFNSFRDSRVQEGELGSGLEILAGTDSATIDVKTSAKSRLELDTLLELEQVSPVNKSVYTKSDRISGQAGDSVNSKGSNGDDMIHSLQIRGLESDHSIHSAGFKDPTWVSGLFDESDFDSGHEEGEALHPSQFTGAVDTKKEVQEFSATITRPHSVSSGSVKSEEMQEDGPSHSAVVTVTTSLQGFESSQMFDREWAEAGPGWDLQSLRFVAQRPTNVDEELRQEVMDD